MASTASQLLQAFVALAAVCLLAVVLLKAAARRGWGTGSGKGPVRVLQRIPLEGRRALYLVRAGRRTLLLGTGESGAPALLAELDGSELAEGLNLVDSSQPVAGEVDPEPEEKG